MRPLFLFCNPFTEERPMQLPWPRLLSAVTAAVLSLPAAARADFITPDSIVRPPPGTVGSAGFSVITSPADLVTSQYLGKGLDFPSLPGPFPGTGPTAAIANLNGTDAWVPAFRTEAMPGRVAVVNYLSPLMGRLVQPGTLTSSAVNSLTVEVLGVPGVTLSAFGGGHLLGSASGGSGTGPHGGELLTVTAPGITAFSVRGPLVPLGGRPGTPLPPAFGLAGVELTLAEAPEPGGLTLAALGLLAVALPVRRRRNGRLATLAIP
jgi:hypothetical protein